MAGLSRTQVKRLLGEYRTRGCVVRKHSTRHRFPRIYTTDDVALLIKADNAVLRRSGRAMAHTFKRMRKRYGQSDYAKLARISVSHLYNLRETRQYQSHALTVSAPSQLPCPSVGEKAKNRRKAGVLSGLIRYIKEI